MATDLENAQAWRSDILLRFANAASATAAGGVPNTIGEGGGTDHMGYRAELLAELRECDALIAQIQKEADGAFEVTSEARG